MPTSGRANPTNSRTLNDNRSSAPSAPSASSPFDGAARALINLGGNALCLCADDDGAAMVRNLVAEVADAPMRLPVLSWRRLCAAAEVLPDGTAPERITEVAGLLQAAGTRWEMNAAIYAQLSAAQKENGGMRLADALAQLFEEMDECGVYDNPAADALAAGGIVDNFLYEAKLIDDIRLALGAGGGERLTKIAAAIDKKLLFVCTNARPPTPLQQKFIDAAEDAEVFCSPPPAEEKHLRAVLSADGATTPFNIGARQCRYYRGLSIAEAARAALVAVKGFLAKRADNIENNDNDDNAKNSGGKKIAIVVYDRLIARRLRALAENDGILIADKSGWRAATLSCGAALATAAAAVARPFDIVDAESLLQPPFWRALTDDGHNQMMEEWGAMIEGAKVLPGSWAEVAAISPPGGVLSSAAHRLNIGGQKAMTAGGWMVFLRSAFAPLLEGYDDDSAAVEMFSRLRTAGGDNQFRAGEFCAWLSLFLRANHFAVDDIDSPVVFVPPQSAAAGFDDLLLLGASNKTLPATNSGIFGERLRAALSLPSRRALMRKERDDFCRLIARRESITAIWCDEDGENPPSPFWQLYIDEVMRCGGIAEQLPPPPPLSSIAAAGINIPKQAAAKIRYAPPRMGAKEAETLMRCPYKFFARAILNLRGQETQTELSPVLEGEILHHALQLWSAAGGDAADIKAWQKALTTAIAKKRRPRQLISECHWLANSGALLQWQSTRQKEGWQTAAAEEMVEAFLPLPSLPGGGITLRGRIDRRDTCGEKTALIDYKRRKNLRNAAGGEDPQLPLYAFLAGCPDAELIICQPVGKDKGKIKPMTVNTRRIIARLRAVARQAASGAPLPANGAPDICQTCEARRLCRKDHIQ